MVYLKLPYISEAISSQVVKFVKKHKLPVKVIFTPGRKLRDVFCSSRPYDKQTCRRKNCVVCDNLEKGECTIQAPVYLVTCLLCEEKYVGETGRSAYDRLSEHLRYARSPTSRSYTVYCGLMARRLGQESERNESYVQQERSADD